MHTGVPDKQVTKQTPFQDKQATKQKAKHHKPLISKRLGDFMHIEKKALVQKHPEQEVKATVFEEAEVMKAQRVAFRKAEKENKTPFKKTMRKAPTFCMTSKFLVDAGTDPITEGDPEDDLEGEFTFSQAMRPSFERTDSIPSIKCLIKVNDKVKN